MEWWTGGFTAREPFLKVTLTLTLSLTPNP